MKEELQKKLVDSFPLLYKQTGLSRSPFYLFGFETDDGWFDLLWNLSDKLEDILKVIPEEDREDIVVFQVKEKFGGLRFYMSCETTKMSQIISMFESLSFEVCEICGSPGKAQNNNGWISTRCEEHK